MTTCPHTPTGCNISGSIVDADPAAQDDTLCFMLADVSAEARTQMHSNLRVPHDGPCALQPAYRLLGH